MKLSERATCWECRVPMEPGEFYTMTRTPEGSWRPHHDPQQRPCNASARPEAKQGGPAPDTSKPAPMPGRPVSATPSSSSAWVHVHRYGHADTLGSYEHVEVVFPWPATNTEDLRGFLRSRLADLKDVCP